MAIAIQPRALNPWKILFVGGVVIALFVWGLFRAPPPPAAFEISGETQGTTYHIRFSAPGLTEQRAGEVQAAVEEYLAGFNDEFSPYEQASTIARFNAAPAGVPFQVSPRFIRLTRISLELAKKSGGAFDPTVGPLVRIWGFHQKGGPQRPTDDQVAAARKKIGWQHLHIREPDALVKDIEGLELDYNAHAPGFSCDEVLDVLLRMGIRNGFVEIGGEVRVSGTNPEGNPWRVGIDAPAPGHEPGRFMSGVLHLNAGATATSGGYRNFVPDGNAEPITHIFDPRTGQPTHRIRQSVTVYAPDCVTADALATTLFVMGPGEGLPWLAREYPDAQALFVNADASEHLTEQSSPDFARRTGYQKTSAPPKP